MAKIRLKLGAMEVEYEGNSKFLQDDLPSLLQKLVGLYTEHKSEIPEELPAEEMKPVRHNRSKVALDHSTNTIAARLGVTSGADLVIAAAAHLMFVQNQEKFTRQQILTEMKAASTYYTKFMSTNLTKMLSGLVKSKRLNQVTNGEYAFSADERDSVEAKLAQSS
jgi:hypothetical protein